MKKWKRPEFFYGYAIVLAAFIILIVTWGSIYSFGIFFKPILIEFGWNRALTSGAYSLFFLLQMVEKTRYQAENSAPQPNHYSWETLHLFRQKE